MEKLIYTHGMYRTKKVLPAFWAKTFPSLTFYIKFIRCVIQGSALAKRGQYDGHAWTQNSFGVLQALESVGVVVEVRGIEHVRQVEGPCVFIANHMSMLETVILPVILQPIKAITFVVKQSLLDYPVFKHIMRSREPVAVSRTNPRLDLKAVLEKGSEKLQTGVSMIIFPQTTRTPSFDPATFNTIGIKLAKKADVPVIPLALVTDAWQNGRYLKDFGKIDSSKKVMFSFGNVLQITGRGNQEHEHIIEFIQNTLLEESKRREE
jgi:1-acyl-sn-glycerol-3-phosphate acyltransferase